QANQPVVATSSERQAPQPAGQPPSPTSYERPVQQPVSQPAAATSYDKPVQQSAAQPAAAPSEKPVQQQASSRPAAAPDPLSHIIEGDTHRRDTVATAFSSLLQNATDTAAPPPAPALRTGGTNDGGTGGNGSTGNKVVTEQAPITQPA